MDATDSDADQLAKGAIGRFRAPAPWWDGRQVAIRPDVPGSAFDPRHSVLVSSDDERIEFQARIDRFVEKTKGKTFEQLWPWWLWDGDVP